MAAPRIVVTGDLVREAHLYQGKRHHSFQETADGSRFLETMGGAQLLCDILDAASPGIAQLDLVVRNGSWPDQLRAYATYGPQLAGFKADPKPPLGQKPKKAWRVATRVGYGFSDGVPPPEPPVTRLGLVESKDVAESLRVLVIDDGGAGFRTLRAKDRWPDCGQIATRLPPWRVLKASPPFAEGDLWRHLVARQEGAALVVVASADDLRRDGAAISRGLSWERTVSETLLALDRHPRFSRLKHASHVLVLFRREGVLWLHGSSVKLVFDARLAEGEWTATLKEEGRVFGHSSVFTAAIAHALAQDKATTDLESELTEAIGCGLASTRELCLVGHGAVGKAAAFPLNEVAASVRGTRPAREPHQPQDVFVSVPLDGLSIGTPQAASWTISALADGAVAVPVPLYGLALQTAIYGPSRLASIPQARFGDLVTIDRDEIEALRGLRQMIQAYEQGGRHKAPLSIAAFGPPGAGKSFGIKQIALEVLGDGVPFLEFNLSQFGNAEDLVGAFHQVRDKVLGGRTPVVFWDEFDSGEYRWLPLLLAPMQDGKFQSGQLTHTLGKCVFVFAGGTSWDFETFGPAPKPVTDEDQDVLDAALKTGNVRELRKKAEAEFRFKKGPDFISRLNGHINVLGPNRRLRYDFRIGDWIKPDPTDITFPVRRALLLRSFLNAKEAEVLEIDRDLLNALIRQPRYRHGARSMEKLVQPLRGDHAPLQLSQLPAPQVLAQHLEPTVAFQTLLNENAEFLTPENLAALAAAIHENYRRLTDPHYVYDPQFRGAYDTLDAWGKATNLAAAARYPYVLAIAGLCVQPGQAAPDEIQRAKDRLELFLDPLSREEHSLWSSYLAGNGWLPSPGLPKTQARSQLLHEFLLPFDMLDQPTQAKDHRAIRTMPETVALVGFKIVPFPDLAV